MTTGLPTRAAVAYSQQHHERASLGDYIQNISLLRVGQNALKWYHELLDEAAKGDLLQVTDRGEVVNDSR